jgi:hypothetical protein
MTTTMTTTTTPTNMMNQKKIIEETLEYIKEAINDLENDLSSLNRSDFETEENFNKELKFVNLKISIDETLKRSLEKYFEQNQHKLVLNLDFDVRMFVDKLLDEIDINLDLLIGKIDLKKSEQQHKKYLSGLLSAYLIICAYT